MPDVVCLDGSSPAAVKDYRLDDKASDVCVSRTDDSLFWQVLRPLYRCPDGRITTAVLWVQYVVDAPRTSTACSAVVTAAAVS